ncbi:glycosyltransferase [Shewanella algae]|uniref:glycosyltransferase family 4 protein n=1 Tax=Shewanella algae TaxID=38313 RepID=UPI002036648D|nr:glycosyltransferase [Shewanella algae]MCM2528634.1 glycosyltransferase [Shewanella algae]
MKVLVCCPSFDVLGGVSNHYYGLSKYLGNDFSFHFIGNRGGRRYAFFQFLIDFIKFLFSKDFLLSDVVLLNPSLGRKSLVRESIYLCACKLFSKKIILHFHGWNPTFSSLISNTMPLYVRLILKADLIILLSKEHVSTLRGWGYNGPISFSTTKVDDEMLNPNNVIFDSPVLSSDSSDVKLLFTGRLVKSKGVWELIYAYEKLISSLDKTISLHIVGSGTEYDSLVRYCTSFKRVYFWGHQPHEHLSSFYIHSDIFVLPSYTEGMSTSVLEAMAFGLPIVSTPEGGINDYFIDGRMGFFCEKKNIESLRVKLTELINHQDAMSSISKFNIEFSKNNFYASKVARNLKSIINSHF